MTLARCVALIAASLIASSLHAQSATFEYTIQPGDSCASIARELYGARERYDVIHAYNDLGPLPHRLTPGQTLTLLRPELARAEATVQRVQDRVEHRPPGLERWGRAAAGLNLGRGHQVVTRDDARAELRFRDGSVLHMRERSLVIVMAEGRHESRSVGRATLERGDLRAHLGRLTEDLDVATPSARARVRGEAWVGVDESGTSRVANRGERPIVVHGERGRVRIRTGEGTLVRRGERPGRPRPLPVSPEWLEGLQGRFVGFVGAGAPIELGWQPVEGAAAYRVELATRPSGNEVVRSVRVSAEHTRARFEGLDAGVYYAGVATIDAEGFEGQSNARRAVVALNARLLPPGGGTHLPRDALPRVVPGTAVVAPSGYRCSTGDAMQTLFTLRELGRRTLRCVDPSGNEILGADVVVVRAQSEVVGAPVLRRGGVTRVRFRVQSPVALPPRLVARAPDGVAVGPIARTDDVYETEIGAVGDAPENVAIELQVAVGAERLAVGTLSLRVR